jgi:RimJ/RimL family protein N-acetyltransferase
MNISLRRATIGDAEKIFELQKSVSSPRAFRGLDDEEQAIKGIREEIARINVYLVEDGGSAVGMVAYQRSDSGDAYISSFLVHPSVQGRGIGSAALGLVLEELKDCEKIEAETHIDNKDMLPLALKFGFVIQGESKNDHGDRILSLVRKRQEP